MSVESHETASTTVLDGEILAIVSQLTNRLSLNGGQVPNSAESFWRIIGVAMSHAVTPGSAAAMARSVLEHLGENWDDDYEDDGRPTLEAYEALLGRITDQERGEQDEDDDDDSTGELAAEPQILVSPIDLVVATLIQWIESGTLVLDPEWQRGYVWKAPRKRRFIESMFMSLPIPPVLLFEDSRTSKLFVIDGRQRLETIYRYSLGTRDKSKSFATFGRKTPGWEEGKPLADAAGKRFDKLPPDFQRRFSTFIVPARKFMNLERRKLYEVFKRYNTGGDKLNPAEIRNAVYQGLALHEMMYRLAGEGGPDSARDAEERAVADRLRALMKGKIQRFGRYNFIGRVLAFSHVRGGSVANAINKLMDKYGQGDPEPLRRRFIDAFNKTWDWYSVPFCAEQANGKTPFHEWVATIQMTTTIAAMAWIEAGRTTEDAIKALIEAEWNSFVQGRPDPDTGELVGGVLQEKQNTTTHWERQDAWLDRLQSTCAAS